MCSGESLQSFKEAQNEKTWSPDKILALIWVSLIHKFMVDDRELLTDL